MIPCIENIKVSSKRLLEIRNEFSKAAKYKINIQKSINFQYTNNELSLQHNPEFIDNLLVSECF